MSGPGKTSSRTRSNAARYPPSRRFSRARRSLLGDLSTGHQFPPRQSAAMRIPTSVVSPPGRRRASRPGARANTESASDMHDIPRKAEKRTTPGDHGAADGPSGTKTRTNHARNPGGEKARHVTRDPLQLAFHHTAVRQRVCRTSSSGNLNRQPNNYIVRIVQCFEPCKPYPSIPTVSWRLG